MTTGLIIQGKAYDMEHATVGADLNLLIYMKRKLGITMRSILDGLERLNAGEDVIDLLSDDEGLESLRGLIWLCKTDDGDRADDGSYLSVEDANKGIGFLDLGFDNGEPDEPEQEAQVEGARPTQAADGAPVEAAQPQS